MDENVENSLCLLSFDRVQGVHREGESVGDELLANENHGGDQDRDDADRRREVIIASDFTHELIVDFYREHPIALPDQQRRTEVRESTHEDEQPGCENRRHGQGDDDLEETADAADPHVRGSLQQGIIHLFQRSRNIEENQREQLKGQHQENPVESIDVGHRESEDLLDGDGDDPRPSQQLDPCISTDERRRHRTEDDQHLKESFSLDFKHVVEISEDVADDQGQDRRPNRHAETVSQGRQIVALTEELIEPMQGESPVGSGERTVQDHVERIQ